MSFLPLVSVIIPVYNDAQKLQKCLDALENQSYPTDSYEVIVIDNGSDETQNIKSVVSKFSHARYTYQEKPSSYAARNQGLSIAKGEIIAFTDADCLPNRDWLEKGVTRLLNTPNCGFVSGHIEVFPKDPNCPTAVELFEMLTAFHQEKNLQNMKYGATANLFTSKQVIQKVGQFNEKLKSAGDLDWGVRVYEASYQQVYDETVKVRHPARASWPEMRKKTIRLVGGHYDLLTMGLYHFFKKESMLFSFSKKSILPSKLLKEIIFLIILMQDLKPPVGVIIRSIRNPKLRNLSEKIKISWVILAVRYTRAWGKMQLKIGKVSTRG